MGKPRGRPLALIAVGMTFALPPVFAASTQGVRTTAETLQKLSTARAGEIQIIEPLPEEMQRTDRRPVGKVLLFLPDQPGQSLVVRLPVRRTGYYRLTAWHVYGAWKQGRYGLYRVKADGVQLPGKFHGWYGSKGAPAHWPKAKTHLVRRSWGVIKLRRPHVELTFTPAGGGLLGVGSLVLKPVAERDLKPEEKSRVAPVRPFAPQHVTKTEDTSLFEVERIGDLKWVVPARRLTVTVDGNLDEWDFSGLGIVATAKTIDKDRLGWKNPDPQGDDDLSAHVQVGWDKQNLYVAGRVVDDQLAETAGQKKWGSPWGHDSVVLKLLPSGWLTSGFRSTGPVPGQYHLGLSYYSSETGPRSLPGGVRYVAKKTDTGYLVEAAVPFTLLGFRPAQGDRIPFMVILSDVDPEKAAPLRFDQYGLPTQGYGTRQVAQIRLLGRSGWGADLMLDRAQASPGAVVRFVGTADVVGQSITVSGVRVRSVKTDKVVARVSCTETLARGSRYRLHGKIKLPRILPAGPYEVTLAVKKRQ
jgi:cellulose/xylan binding protein with CBM9 domain